MGVFMVLGDDSHLRVTVSGDFDFEKSRQLLLEVRAHCRDGSKAVGRVEVTLRGVTRASACAIGALMLIAEQVGRNLAIRTEHCSSEVHGLFSSGVLDRFFAPEVLAGCCACLARSEPDCSEGERSRSEFSAAS